MGEIDYNLTDKEIDEIRAYTVLKIESYPKHYGNTVENYYHLLFPDEVKDYIFRRHLNRQRETNRKRKEAMA